MREIYVFYADVFLIQNFVMDLIALFSTNYFLRRYRKWRYLITASIATSLTGLLVLLLIENKIVYLFFSHFVVNTIMAFIAFGRCKYREFAENWLVTYVIVIFLGGIVTWLRENRFMTGNVMLLGIIGVIGLYGTLFYLMQRRNMSNHILEIRVSNRDKTMLLKAYWDSGNQLRDPYTGQGICILSEERARELFDEKKQRFRLVPYRSLGETEGMLWVTDIEELHIYDGRKKVHMRHVAIGVANAGLMKNCGYELILHASFL